MNLENFEITEIGEDDLEKEKEFLEFVNSLVEEKAKIFVKEEKSIADCKDWLEEIWEKVTLNEQIFLFGKINQKIVGVAEIFKKEEAKDHLLEIAISVKKEYRNLGIGKLLIKELFRLAEERFDNNSKFITLTVFSNNQIAIRFYQKFDFEIVAEIPNQLQSGKELVSEVVMMKEF